jgi:hypothetical protein
MAEGTAETVFADLHGENPFDLVPVRPLKEMEEHVTNVHKQNCVNALKC